MESKNSNLSPFDRNMSVDVSNIDMSYITSHGGPLNIPVAFKKLANFHSLPRYATNGAAAMDICSAVDAYVKKDIVEKIATGIAVQIPGGYEIQVRSRSGLASKGVIVVNAPGTIDSDYTGEIFILLASITGGCQIKKGDRIAQLVLAPVTRIDLVEVDTFTETERGDGGFGSTGL